MEKVFVDVWDIHKRPLDINAGLEFVTRPPNGAEALFIGTVRHHNQGRKVLGVSYDVFEPLAKKMFKDICKEAQEKWGNDLNLYVVHAKGRLPIGGISIVIAAGSPHRDEAFKACRYMIEEIKHRAPIWKLEHYVEGDSQWTQGCELCTSSATHEKQKHYA
jgi:molybdopterin synthase catalytic subunit